MFLGQSKMRLLLLISVFSLTIGAPFPITGGDSDEYPDTEEVETGDPGPNTEEPVSFKFVQLDEGCTIAWKVLGESLLISLKLSRVNKWIVLGFSDVEKPVKKLNQALFFRIRRTKPITVKVCRFSIKMLDYIKICNQSKTAMEKGV